MTYVSQETPDETSFQLHKSVNVGLVQGCGVGVTTSLGSPFLEGSPPAPGQG